LTWQTFHDEHEAIDLANSTAYGLSAMVFTRDDARAQRFALGVRAGTIWANCFLIRDLTAPFGGIGQSGIGREGGDYALDFYSDLKTFQVKEDTTNG
jgi:betaine-aldehyde dehydrogenase/5-carboxymethyl-2-hydroxymuconic-semialdehyde dehydrogenase